MSEDQYKKIFSSNLKRYMELNGKSQIDLINDLGFNKSAVSTWCNGTRLPRMDKVDALAKYFRINRSDLIEEPKEEVDTIAAHHDSEKWTQEELDEIEEFKKYVLSKRKNK